MFFLHSQKGVTLLEIMLVLAIATTVFLMGLRMYQMFNIDRNLQRVNYDVDRLFQGMKNYFPANCKSVAMSLSGTNPLPVDTASLVSSGFLDNWPPNQSPIVESSSYVAQFNLSTSTRNIYQCYKNLSTDTVTCSSPEAIKATNTVALWRIQVAVAVLSSASADARKYCNMLSASCLSTKSGSTVNPCSSGSTCNNTSGSYLVWERIPSSATPTAQSSLWLSNPILQQFNRLYTNDDFYAFGTNDPSYNSGAYQNYLCGG